MRRCIAKLSGSCEKVFLSEWSGQRYCGPCREYIRKNAVQECPEGGDDTFDEETYGWALRVPSLKSKEK